MATYLDLNVGPMLTHDGDPSRDHGQSPGSAHVVEMACDFRSHPMAQDLEVPVHEPQEALLLGGRERLPETIEVRSQRVKEWYPPAELLRSRSGPCQHLADRPQVKRRMHFRMLHGLLVVRGRQQTVPRDRNYRTVPSGVQTQGDVDCRQTRTDEEDG
jgi:hypothetical protein